MAPGTRFARGTRTGRPEVVTPLEDGATIAFAAIQPLSAGDAQPASGAAVPSNCLWRLANQSDSTAS
jgi:hypothetical protein